MRVRVRQCLAVLALSLLEAFARTSDAANPAPERRSINDGMDLRILPLGASITAGQDSSDWNGYRQKLQQLLKAGGNSVNYVGTRFYGNMTDNACEAYPGYTIEQVDNATMLSGAYDFQPNIILIAVGTNDCNRKSRNPAGAPQRYAKLLEHIRSDVPDALVVISSLIHNLNPTVNACIRTLNEGLRRVSREARADGQRTTFAEMYDAVSVDDINKKDKTHPDDDGYSAMAEVWYRAIVRAASNISAPAQAARTPLDSPGPRSEASGLAWPAWTVIGGLVTLCVVLN